MKNKAFKSHPAAQRTAMTETLRNTNRDEGVLCVADCEILAKCFAEYLDCRSRLIGSFGVAKYIKHPQVPKKLSESLAIHLLNKDKILDKYEKITEARLGGNKSDIMASLPTGEDIHIEVKATGSAHFISIGANDRRADFLLWLVFKIGP
jgi:hypothetical protein